MKKVTIVLPVYNGSKYLRHSVESVIAQTYQNWELIIVNDCSSDASPQIAENTRIWSTPVGTAGSG